LLTAELDSSLFRRRGELVEKKEKRIRQFLDVLRRAIGPEQSTQTTRRKILPLTR